MENFVQLATRTESNDFDAITQRLRYKRTIRLLHAAMGLATEAGETLDMLKKHIFYGKPLDDVNLKEEIGDMLWYMAICFDEMNWTLDETEQLVIAKLRKRYPSKFEAEQALNRDLEGERQILENGVEKVQVRFIVNSWSNIVEVPANTKIGEAFVKAVEMKTSTINIEPHRYNYRYGRNGIDLNPEITVGWYKEHCNNFDSLTPTIYVTIPAGLGG